MDPQRWDDAMALNTFDVADVTPLDLAGRCSLIDLASCPASPLRNDGEAILKRDMGKRVMTRVL